jgi:hypothetical protein
VVEVPSEPSSRWVNPSRSFRVPYPTDRVSNLGTCNSRRKRPSSSASLFGKSTFGGCLRASRNLSTWPSCQGARRIRQQIGLGVEKPLNNGSFAGRPVENSTATLEARRLGLFWVPRIALLPVAQRFNSAAGAQKWQLKIPHRQRGRDVPKATCEVLGPTVYMTGHGSSLDTPWPWCVGAVKGPSLAHLNALQKLASVRGHKGSLPASQGGYLRIARHIETKPAASRLGRIRTSQSPPPH